MACLYGYKKREYNGPQETPFPSSQALTTDIVLFYRPSDT